MSRLCLAPGRRVRTPMPPLRTHGESFWKIRARNLWYRNSRRSSGKGRPLSFAWAFNLESTAVRKAAGV
jgi:hypothetical protein